MGDHDSLFKRAFAVPANAAGELRSVLPPSLSASIDLASLELEPASFVDAEMEHRHADLLFSASIAGRPSYVFFLFEHQSEPDPMMPWRVLTYQQRIWAAVIREEPTRTTLPPIVCVVVHHGAQGWSAPRRFHELVEGLDDSPELRPFVPDFELVIDDLVRADDADLHRRPLAAFPKVTLWLLRDGRSLNAFRAHLAAWADELERLIREDPTRNDYRTALRYIWRVIGEGPYELVRQSIIAVAPTFGGAMPSVEEQLIEKGRREGLQKGREEGRAEGRAEGLRDALVKLLRARFGALDTPTEQRIAEGSMADVDRWVQQAIVAVRVDDVFEE